VTTFAVLYNRQDLAAIAADATNPGLSSSDRNEANRYWNGGLRDWSTAPVAPVEYRCVTNGSGTFCDDDMRVVVVSGAQVSKAGLVTLLRRIGTTYPGALYMQAIADDVANTAVEPWPPA
jgi:hypothetical protein